MNTKKPYTADHLADDIHQGYLALKGFGIGLLAWLLGQTLIIAGTFAVYLLTTLLLIAMNWANPAIIIALTHRLWCFGHLALLLL